MPQEFDTDHQVERHLGDYLDVEKVRRLYSDNQNGYGSSRLTAGIGRLLESYAGTQVMENKLSASYGSVDTEESLRGTNDIMRYRAEKLIKASLSRHVAAKAPQLEAALVAMGLDPEQISELPRNTDGHIDDSFAAGPRSGTSLLYNQFYKPQIEQLFSSDRKTRDAQGRA